MAPSAGEPASDTADGLRSFILDQMEAQAAEDEVIPEEVERRFVENALRACARMTRETQKSRNKLTLLHQEFDSKDGEWAREHESFNAAQRVAVSSEEISVADQLD